MAAKTDSAPSVPIAPGERAENVAALTNGTPLSASDEEVLTALTLFQQAIDAIDQNGQATSRELREGFKRTTKAIDVLGEMAREDDEVRAWDRFVAAAIARCPPVDNVGELTAYCEEVAGALVAKRRELFDEAPGESAERPNDDREIVTRAERAAPKGKLSIRDLIESAQRLEAKALGEREHTGEIRTDLLERAKLLRDRADRALGIEPPTPLTKEQVPSAVNAAAERRVHETTNGAAK
jgi:hypothetical protein